MDIQNFKDIVLINFVDNWRQNICKMPKLCTYVLFKNEFCMENYLMYVKSSKLRKLLSKLRLSSHDLFIEKGRYTNIPREQRLCKFCNSGNIEDEKHFIIDCTLYREEHSKLFSLLNIRIIDENTFIKLMSLKQSEQLFILCRFIQLCFKKRSVMYSL